MCLCPQEDGLEQSRELFASAVKHYEDAIELLPAEERNKPIKQQVAGVSAPSAPQRLLQLALIVCLDLMLLAVGQCAECIQNQQNLMHAYPMI